MASSGPGKTSLLSALPNSIKEHGLPHLEPVQMSLRKPAAGCRGLPPLQRRSATQEIHKTGECRPQVVLWVDRTLPVSHALSTVPHRKRADSLYRLCRAVAVRGTDGA
jgi:hypothetical protein